jgi:hypothetical protein
MGSQNKIEELTPHQKVDAGDHIDCSARLATSCTAAEWQVFLARDRPQSSDRLIPRPEAAPEKTPTPDELAGEWKTAYQKYRAGDKQAFNMFDQHVRSYLKAELAPHLELIAGGGARLSDGNIDSALEKVSKLLPDGCGLVAHRPPFNDERVGPEIITIQNIHQVPGKAGDYKDKTYGPLEVLSTPAEVIQGSGPTKVEQPVRFTELPAWPRLSPETIKRWKEAPTRFEDPPKPLHLRRDPELLTID